MLTVFTNVRHTSAPTATYYLAICYRLITEEGQTQKILLKPGLILTLGHNLSILTPALEELADTSLFSACVPWTWACAQGVPGHILSGADGLDP